MDKVNVPQLGVESITQGHPDLDQDKTETD